MTNQNIISTIKDKAALLSKPWTLSLHLALLRATNHDPFTFPITKRLATVLSFGNGSRATTSTVVETLMDRLQSTHNSAVALKCLVVVHHIIKHGSFILQDQLSVYPSNGGRNYLKLSNFRDHSSPICWELSSWVRWYAQYIEQLLCTSRTLGFFLGSTSCTLVRDKQDQEERVFSITNRELIREIDYLADLVVESCKRPDLVHMEGNKLLDGVVKLVGENCVSAISEISVRVHEFNERLGCLRFGEAVELVSTLKRLEESKEKMVLLDVQTRKVSSIESFWDRVRQLKNEVGMKRMYMEDGKVSLLTMKRERLSESARFAGLDFKPSRIVKFFIS